MPSLKDLRNRIAATKATQKITRAMQMVASSKLRRARAAAEAARPYASRMDTVLGNIAASVAGVDTAPALLRGTGSDQKHLLLVCTAERGLCGPFNTAIVRLARERAGVLTAEGKDVKFFCVGRKGYDQLRRIYPNRSSNWSTFVRCACCVSKTPSASPERSSRCSTNSSLTSVCCFTRDFAP